jgi:DNA polymerase II small subunit/DNA polymerase delta subunit B
MDIFDVGNVHKFTVGKVGGIGWIIDFATTNKQEKN